VAHTVQQRARRAGKAIPFSAAPLPSRERRGPPRQLSETELGLGVPGRAPPGSHLAMGRRRDILDRLRCAYADPPRLCSRGLGVGRVTGDPGRPHLEPDVRTVRWRAL